MDLKEYVRLYDGALDANLCRNIIEAAKNSKTERWEREGRPQWNMFNVTVAAEQDNNPTWVKIQNQLITAIKEYSEQYMTELGCADFWPPENALEQIRLKHYECEKNDRFDLHADVGDHNSAKRFLALFFYLNDVELGGETYFPDLDIKIQPKEGSCLIFPPTWMFPHSGKAPQSNDKYIIGTYLHYL